MKDRIRVMTVARCLVGEIGISQKKSHRCMSSYNCGDMVCTVAPRGDT